MKPALTDSKDDKKKKSKRRPDPTRNYAVPHDDRPTQGPDDALITIVAFSDFECPYCSRVLAALGRVQKENKDVRVVFRNHPLSFHKNAKMAAKAALAKELKLDVPKFDKDMDSDLVAKQLAEDQELAKELGTTGTPGFFINGRFLGGAQPYDKFEKLIAEERQKAKAFQAKSDVQARELYGAMVSSYQAPMNKGE